MIRTPEEAFEAGWREPCAHNVWPVRNCPTCRLTPEEARRIVTLLRLKPRAAAA